MFYGEGMGCNEEANRRLARENRIREEIEWEKEKAKMFRNGMIILAILLVGVLLYYN